MKIAVTGMVGIDKKSYLEKVCDIAEANGKSVRLFNVGDMMYAEVPDVTYGKILDISLKRLHLLRRSVFKDIIAKSENKENTIINTHATFRWRHGLFPAIDFDQMRQLSVDMYICIIDGVAPLHHRLDFQHNIEHTLKDLIVWREEEIICTEMLRSGIDETVPFYCLARGSDMETCDTFYKLAFERHKRKAYLSFPMTNVVDMPEVQKKINFFREQMKSYFICFDPADLEESYLPHWARKAKLKGIEYIEVDVLGKKILLNADQVLQIERDINSQIYARDFLLIDQSDMIISYIPTLADGRAAISSGVERELQHAHEAAKEVFVIWTAKHPPSVFVTQTATKVFKTAEEALGFFEKEGYIKNEGS